MYVPTHRQRLLYMRQKYATRHEKYKSSSTLPTTSFPSNTRPQVPNSLLEIVLQYRYCKFFLKPFQPYFSLFVLICKKKSTSLQNDQTTSSRFFPMHAKVLPYFLGHPTRWLWYLPDLEFKTSYWGFPHFFFLVW